MSNSSFPYPLLIGPEYAACQHSSNTYKPGFDGRWAYPWWFSLSCWMQSSPQDLFTCALSRWATSSTSCASTSRTGSYIYIMYSRQLPWGILISYHKWNEINFIYLIPDFIPAQCLFHYQQILFHSLTASISFSHGICFIHWWHVSHSPMACISFVASFISFTMAFISFVASFISFSHGIYFIVPRHLFHL